MADPRTYRPRPGEIPNDPGVYRFRDAHGRVIYVGKAKSLRPRLSSYFQDITALHPRTATMVTTAASVEWTVVRTEVEALQLEYSWIKEFDPRFNVKYRDDKSYPFLAVTMGEEYPRAQVMRGAKRKGTRYFGPYGHAWAIRETLDLLLRVFPVRTCSSGVFRRAAASGRPCLLGYIDKCSAPCVGRVSADEHRAIAEDFCDFMGGNTARFVKRFETRMREAASELDFETAARLRDDIGALSKALEKQAVVLADATDADVFALADDELEAAVQVFHVRGGRIRGQRGWVVEKESEDLPQLVEHLLLQVYGDADRDSVPREVLVPTLPVDPDSVGEWLSSVRGSAVSVRVPQRGDKRTLMETVRRNADQSLARHKVARAGDLTLRSKALQELQEYLDLDEAPLRIECYDVSHVQGTNVVASMVVFEDGLARKSEYRRFIVRGTQVGDEPVTPAGRGVVVDGELTVDDTAAMREVLTRRFRRYLEDAEGAGDLDLSTGVVGESTPVVPVGAGFPGGPVNGSEVPEGRGDDSRDGGDDEDAPSAGGPIDPETGRPRRFAYPPSLVVVDGGLPQVNAAQAVLDELGIEEVALVGLAKRLEEVWLPRQEHPVILPRTSEGLYLLQRLRDEAHRFAITFHRQRRSKAMTTSQLDGIPGLGATRQKALLKHFGSVKRLRQADAGAITEVPGIGQSLASVIVSHLAEGAPQEPAVNLTTGEVLE
ncbi:excinuclease ABC subunit UvrC [Terracoccus luteus]|uniref:UvrABC system protein C n=1 Tax=Terracoccus luteus TaxID=53356 RepID=A0A839Q550_9MICO|nr:excinuclease ABC subunit UvrC [Terracoccus luteus]MBB2987751.1 excinuclease ABC subunit C [Terracoccus luteus]MCP2173402.1 excinuclease ABC subunit C [Terracoccus luteus]